MSVYNQYNTLFHRCVDKKDDPRNTVEIYNSPLPALLYDKNTPENPLYGMDIPKLGSFIFLGVYNNKPIKWKILASEYDGLLLISENILFLKDFDSSTSVWENSSLRSYLNSDFYNTSFSEEEKKFFVTVTTSTGVNDKVFLLSSSGSYQYNYSVFSTSDGRKAKYNGEYVYWWLRSSKSSDRCYVVRHDGSIGDLNVTENVGVRPVIKIKKQEQKTYTIVNFGTYNNNPIEWRILGYDLINEGVVLLSEYILFTKEFDSSSNIWKNSSLRSYLNTDDNSFYSIAFSLQEKSFIKTVKTDDITFDKVFLLSGRSTDRYCYQNYLLRTDQKRKATFNNEPVKWWLRLKSSINNQNVFYITENGQIQEGNGVTITSEIGVRPVIVVDIRALNKTNKILNPLYCSSVWGRMTFPNTKDKDNYYLTVSDPLSTHNQKYQGHNREIYDKIKNDFALFTMTCGNSVIEMKYNYIFKNETQECNIPYSSLTKIPDGVYITKKCVFIKEKDKLYQSGFTSIKDSMDQLFLSKFEEKDFSYVGEIFPKYAIYTSCWEDLNPRLELYLPVSNLPDNSANSLNRKPDILTYYWLGDPFYCEVPIYYSQQPQYILNQELKVIFKELCIKYEGPFI